MSNTTFYTVPEVSSYLAAYNGEVETVLYGTIPCQLTHHEQRVVRIFARAHEDHRTETLEVGGEHSLRLISSDVLQDIEAVLNKIRQAHQDHQALYAPRRRDLPVRRVTTPTSSSCSLKASLVFGAVAAGLAATAWMAASQK